MGILLSATEVATDAATTAETAEPVSGVLLIGFYVLLFVGMWFFLMRPQKKEQKRVAAMLAALETGDCVMTTSGFYGIVLDITDDTVVVEFGNNKNCRIPMDKSAISRVEKPSEN